VLRVWGLNCDGSGWICGEGRRWLNRWLYVYVLCLGIFFCLKVPSVDCVCRPTVAFMPFLVVPLFRIVRLRDVYNITCSTKPNGYANKQTHNPYFPNQPLLPRQLLWVGGGGGGVEEGWRGKSSAVNSGRSCFFGQPQQQRYKERRKKKT